MARSAPTPNSDHWDVITNVTIGTTVQGWTAPYKRVLPFTPNTGWTDGDRVGYKCLYGFLMWNGEPVGRVTFTRIPEAGSYAMVNDRYMVEGSRYYDGTVNTNRNLSQLNDCPPPSEAYSAPSISERPIIKFTATTGELLEVRSYVNTQPGPDVTFETVKVTPERVTVVASANGQPFVAIYYDSMDTSKVVMSSDR